jgi:hypothetical protein
MFIHLTECYTMYIAAYVSVGQKIRCHTKTVGFLSFFFICLSYANLSHVIRIVQQCASPNNLACQESHTVFTRYLMNRKIHQQSPLMVVNKCGFSLLILYNRCCCNQHIWVTANIISGSSLIYFSDQTFY